MEFDATTFALEIINFLVLVWLLQHFLYKPVTAVIAQRQSGIEKTLSDAQSTRSEADALKRQYDARTTAWEQEKAKAREQLQLEIEAERTRLMTGLQSSLDEERNKLRAIEQRRSLEQRHRVEEEARAEGARFAASLLSRLASLDLEERICHLLLEDLPLLSDQQLRALRVLDQTVGVEVTSAFPLDASQRMELNEVVDQLAGKSVTCTFKQDPELVAGLRLSVGPWMLRANLKDELHFFTEAQHADARR